MEHAPECIAECQAEAALLRLGDDSRRFPRVVRLDLQSLRFDQFLPVLLKHLVLIVSRTCRITSNSFDGYAFPNHKTRQTRRRFGGRQPLCGIGVTSRIDVTVRPTACKALSADSRPEPGPLTSTSSVRMPCSDAFLAASSAATCAAYGVDLRDPLNPIVPADDHAIALPCASVMVIMVLLKDALTCATPDAIFFFSRRRTRPGAASFAILVSFADEAKCLRRRSQKFALGFLLAGNRARRTLARARVGMRTLAANRQAAAMTKAAVATEVHQPLDVHRNFTAKV